MGVSLVVLTDGNREAALALRVAPERERFVWDRQETRWPTPPEYPHAKAWYRLAYEGDVPVGFVMISWEAEPQPPEIIEP